MCPGCWKATRPAGAEGREQRADSFEKPVSLRLRPSRSSWFWLRTHSRWLARRPHACGLWELPDLKVCAPPSYPTSLGVVGPPRKNGSHPHGSHWEWWHVGPAAAAEKPRVVDGLGLAEQGSNSCRTLCAARRGVGYLLYMYSTCTRHGTYLYSSRLQRQPGLGDNRDS